MSSLTVKIGELELKNPVMLASGTCGTEQAKFTDFSKLGAVITKSVKLEHTIGNLPPRVAETTGGMLNSIGLENPGVEEFIKSKLPIWMELNTPIIVSVAGKSRDEYLKVVDMLNTTDIAGFEINVSCPNVERGIDFCKDPHSLNRLCYSIRRITEKPVIVKLSPNVSDIQEIAVAAEDSGVDAIALINTLYGLKIDLKTKNSVLGGITGGLSGPCIKPVALYNVYKVSQVCKIPIIGMGGIANAEDALEFLVVGATAVQIGTANFVDPDVGVKIAQGIGKYCEEYKITTLKEIIKTRFFD